MSYLDQIDPGRVPQHVAIIMDGNGRWAKSKGQPRSAGHQAGVKSLHETLRGAKEAGVKYLTVYTFSTENWNRPQQEVETLMNLMVWAIEQETPGMIENGVSLQVIGDMSRLPENTRQRLQKCISDTAGGKLITLILAISYSARWEITRAARLLAEKVQSGEMKADEITEDAVSAQLTTVSYPDPDLLIRTGGEVRISNYLLWQIAYAELYFCDTYWPEFGPEDLYKAIVEYQSRERRFGKTSEQVSDETK